MARVCMVLFNDYSWDPRVRREAEALVERGDTVHCICLGSKKLTCLEGVRLFCFPGKKYQGANPFWLLMDYLQFFCYAFLKVAFLHLKKPYDIVQAHTMPDFLVFTALIPKLLGARVILDIHDLMPELYVAKFSSRHGKWIVKFITWVERRSVAFADKTIAVHKPHLDALTEHGNPAAKFSVLLNVPDHRIFKRQRPARRQPDKFRLIYHGTLPQRAGVDVALRAVARARTEIPHLELHVVGGGEGLEHLTQLVQDLNLANCVEFTPPVPVEKLPAIIARADVGVIPYLSDVFTQYVLPTKLLEYAAVGIPAIVTRLRTVEWYFDADMVAYCEPGNDIDLAAQIVRLYRNPDLALGLASNAARFTDTFNWAQHRQIYFRLVDSLLPARGVFANSESKG
ncbi:MAG TPA: glycosyltransferase family 4 protein [Terriglobia bacterium]|nr:glycosyltransferase family 4 protein [Terriglobia bacterium]